MYKVGDKVKVRSNLQIGHLYGRYTFVHYMSKYFGEWARIVSIRSVGYNIDIDNGKWIWSEEMFESNHSNKLFKLM